MDGKITEFAMSNGYGGTLVIRCKAACEAYLTIDRDIFADQQSVRGKFNAAAAKRFGVNRAKVLTHCSSLTPMGC